MSINLLRVVAWIYEKVAERSDARRNKATSHCGCNVAIILRIDKSSVRLLSVDDSSLQWDDTIVGKAPVHRSLIEIGLSVILGLNN